MRAAAQGPACSPAHPLGCSAPAWRLCPWSWSRWRQDPRLLASGAANALTTEGRPPGLGGGPAWARGGSQRRGRARETRKQLVKPGVLRDTDTAAPREGPCRPLAEFGLYTNGEKMKTF